MLDHLTTVLPDISTSIVHQLIKFALFCPNGENIKKIFQKRIVFSSNFPSEAENVLALFMYDTTKRCPLYHVLH